jgi:phosphatidylglycerol:prolipoprotein diacylglycerol transferase
MFLHTYIPNSTLFDLGFYQIRWYGVILACAVASGFFVFYKLLKKKEIWSEYFFNLLFWIAFCGIIGGRLVHILTFLNYYLKNPLQIFAIWNGGIAFYGVFVGGLLSILFLFKKYIIYNSPARLNNFSRSGGLFIILDALAVALSLGQFIGRFGNWFNQELFGKSTNLPWGIPIDIFHRPIGFENFQYFHPIFLYESLFSLALFFLLLCVYKKNNNGTMKQWSNGIVFSLFLIFHSTARFFLEFLRLDIQPIIFGFRLFQIVAIAEFIFGIIILIKIQKRKNKIFDK